MDVLVVLYYRSILANLIILAALMSFVLTIVPFLVAQLGIVNRRPSIFLVYALGAAIGTWLGMMIRL